MFSRLLAGDEEKGFCDVVVADLVETEVALLAQHRDRRDDHDRRARRQAAHRRLRAALRFASNATYRPPQIIRRIEPLAGLPRIAIRVRPTHNYGRPTTNVVRRFQPHSLCRRPARCMRLTTDAPLSYIVNEITFPLTRPVNLIFGQDEPFLTAIDTTSREFLERTRDHWLTWVRNSGGAVRVAGGGDARGDHPQAVQFRGDRRDRRRAYDVAARSAVIVAQRGTTATAGCGTPISSSTR